MPWAMQTQGGLWWGCTHIAFVVGMYIQYRYKKHRIRTNLTFLGEELFSFPGVKKRCSPKIYGESLQKKHVSFLLHASNLTSPFRNQLRKLIRRCKDKNDLLANINLENQ